MSAVLASQLVLHPRISQVLRFLSFTVSRDKVYRSLQYLARFLAWFYARNGWKDVGPLGVSWNAMKGQLSTARKLMRIGKPLEHAQAAVRALDTPDAVLRLTAFGRQIGYFLFLFYDAVLWFHASRVRPLSPPTADKVARHAFRFWAFGLACSLLSGVYKEAGVRAKLARARRAALVEKTGEGEGEVGRLESAKKANRKQIFQDSLDLLIPTSGLGWVNPGEGVVGLAGLITSLMGAKTQWEATVGRKSA